MLHGTGIFPRRPVIPPEVWCFRYVFGNQIPSQEVFGFLGIYLGEWPKFMGSMQVNIPVPVGAFGWSYPQVSNSTSCCWCVAYTTTAQITVHEILPVPGAMRISSLSLGRLPPHDFFG